MKYDIFMTDRTVYTKCTVMGNDGTFYVVIHRSGRLLLNGQHIIKMLENTDPEVGIAPDGPVDGVIGKIGVSQ